MLAALASYIFLSARRAARRYSAGGELCGRRLEQPLAWRRARRAAQRSTCHLLASSVTASPLAMYVVAVCVTAASVSIHSPSRSAP